MKLIEVLLGKIINSRYTKVLASAPMLGRLIRAIGNILISKVGTLYAYNEGGIRVLLESPPQSDYMMVLEAITEKMPVTAFFTILGVMMHDILCQ